MRGACRLSHDESSSMVAVAASGVLLVGFLFVPVYDLIAFLTYKLGWEKKFDPIDVYAGESPAPGQPPISQKTKLRLFYPLALAVVIFALLPSWTKFAYCG
jgi:hypothetical protein